jgi:hypothetical protein
MRACSPTTIAALALSLAAAPALAGAPPLEDWAGGLGWGAPLPGGLEPEADYPWAAEASARCGWQGEVLLCDDGQGLSRAYRAWEGPVEGRPFWIRCAGLEWCAGTLAEAEVDGRRLGRWAYRLPPHRGWEWSLAETAGEGEGGPKAQGLTVEGGDGGWPGAETEARIAACPGAGALDQLPIEVLYFEGAPRKVRFQGWPPEGLAVRCVVEALSGAPKPVEGDSVEVMLTGVGG